MHKEEIVLLEQEQAEYSCIDASYRLSVEVYNEEVAGHSPQAVHCAVRLFGQLRARALFHCEVYAQCTCIQRALYQLRIQQDPVL